MTWHVLARHYMTWHLHHCIDLLIVWLHEDARPSSPGEQAKGGGGQVEKWTSVNFFWFVQEIFLYVSICAIEFRGCKSWPKRAPLSILFILILDTYLGPTSHKMRNWTWSWFRENLPCQLLISELENAGFWRFRAEWKHLAAMAVESCAACGLIQALYGRCTWPPFAKVHPQLRRRMNFLYLLVMKTDNWDLSGMCKYCFQQKSNRLTLPRNNEVDHGKCVHTGPTCCLVAAPNKVFSLANLKSDIP